MNPPLEPWNDPTLEARVVARVLGEASAFECAEVDRLLDESPELAAFARRIRAVHGLLGETARGSADDLWKMEPERRSKLLLALGAAAPAAEPTPSSPAGRKRRPFAVRKLAAAAALAFGLFAASLLAIFGPAGTWKSARETVASRSAIRTPEQSSRDALAAASPALPEADSLAPLARNAPMPPPAPPPSPDGGEANIATGFAFGGGIGGHGWARSDFQSHGASDREPMRKHLEVARETADAGVQLTGAKQETESQVAQGAGNPTIADGAATTARGTGAGTIDMDGFSGDGEPINAGRGSGSPVSRRKIDALLADTAAPKESRLDELAAREDVADVEVIRESKPVIVTSGGTLELPLQEEMAARPPFPVTPATPVDFEEKVDSFGNTVRFPTEYEPPALPAGITRSRREDVSKLDPEDAAKLGDIPVLAGLFQDRWDATPVPPAEQNEAGAATPANAPATEGGALSRKPEEKDEKQTDANVDPFAAAPDEAPADPFAGEPETPQAREKPPAPGPEKPAAPTLENKLTENEPVSTFSLHVSDASFQLGARALLGGGSLPPESVRAEDYVNAMDYGDAMPARGEAVSAVIQQSGQPFVPGRNLLRIGVRTAADGRAQGQPLSLVLLVDQSGSMERPDRVAAMDRALGELAGLLGKDDTLTVIGFAREPRLLADRISGDQAANIPALVRNSPPQGGTNLEAAMDLAAEAAARQNQPGARNRIVLFTDGATNLGQIDPGKLAARVDALRRQRIAFDACGVGTAGLADNVLEAMARRGDGRYLLLDAEGESSFAKQLAGAFRPAARNVKVQVRFNPERVEAYQLFGFENHLLDEDDFRDDSIDAAELAAAEQGNALYQIRLRAGGRGDIGDVAVRFQETGSGRMVERHWPIPFDQSTPSLEQADPSMQLAAAAGLLAESLRGSPVGRSVDPAALAGVLANLRSAFPGDPRVATLLAMWEQVRQRP